MQEIGVFFEEDVFLFLELGVDALENGRDCDIFAEVIYDLRVCRCDCWVGYVEQTLFVLSLEVYFVPVLVVEFIAVYDSFV